MEQNQIHVGMRLGTQNNVVAMWLTGKGWRVKDSTGEIYSEERFPQGLCVVGDDESDPGSWPRLPWSAS